MHKIISPTDEKILNTLHDGQLHSGAVLAKTLGLSRTAVWKRIHELQNAGIAIESLAPKGYRLPITAQTITQSALEKALSDLGWPKARKIDCFLCIDSTNHFLKNQTWSDCIQICTSEQQTAGRGRMGKNWDSPPGSQLIVSLRYHLSTDWQKLEGLSLIVGLALRSVLAQYQNPPALLLKWPNDIYCNNAKLAGILIELGGEAQGDLDITIGVGCNLFPDDKYIIPKAALFKDIPKDFDKTWLSAQCIVAIDTYISRFLAEGLSGFLSEWEQFDYLKGKTVVAKNTAGETLNGTVQGIEKNGSLLLKIADGIAAFHAGEISLGQI